MGVANIAAVFEEVNRKHVDYGVVPLENSTDGRVADTLDMFVRLPQIKICSEVRLRVHHNLLANCEQTEIARIYSKPQALSQCRNWIAKNVPQATLHEWPARRPQRSWPRASPAQRRRHRGGGSHTACEFFPNIEDSPHNETRFAVIGLTMPRTGATRPPSCSKYRTAPARWRTS